MRYYKNFKQLFLLFYVLINMQVGLFAASIKEKSYINEIDTLLINSFIDSGKYYRNFQPDSAIYYFKKARKLAEHRNLQEWMAQSIYRIGEIHADIGNYDTANYYYEQALQLYFEFKDKKGIAKIYTLLGIINANKGNYLEALDFYNQSLASYDWLNHYDGMASCYNNIGVIYLNKGMYKNAVAEFFKAIQLFEKSDNQMGIAKAYNNIGLIFYNQKLYHQALNYYIKARAIFKKINNTKGLIGTNNNIGSIYKFLNHINEAKWHYWQALQLARDFGDKMGISQALNNLGILESDVANYKQAEEFYLQSLQISRELEDKEGLASTMINLAHLYVKTKRYAVAMQHAQQALKIAESCELLDLQKSAYEYMAIVFAALKNYEKAFENHKLYKKFSDSLLNQILHNQINQLESKFQLERKQLEIENLQTERKHQQEKIYFQQQATYGLIVGISITLILLLLAWYNYKAKQKSNVLLAMQNIEIQQKSNEILQKNQKIEEQHELLQRKNENIIASITYAKHIQNAILPKAEVMEEIFADSFVLFKPKAIVSGDFYYVEETANSYIVAVIDCTGHGVPGALMTSMGYVLFKQALETCNYQQPKEILNVLGKKIYKTMNYAGMPKIKDTMDLSLCIIYKKYLLLEYAGVHNPVYIIRNQQLIELQPETHCIGEPFNEDFTGYSQQQYFLRPQDAVYLFSDGYVDQFGGDKGKKFMTKNFKELLVQNSHLPMAKQKEILNFTLENWKNNHQGVTEQIDDVTVMGFRVNG